MERLGAIATALTLKSTSRVAMLIRDVSEQSTRQDAPSSHHHWSKGAREVPAPVMRRQIDPELQATA